MRFKYVDDLTILELVLFGGLLMEYDFKLHVASDIGIEEHYISADNLETQAHLDDISHWTTENKMKLNEKKSNYMVFTRSNTEFATRLHLNNHTLDRIEEVKLLGVWITTWLDWDKNTREICKKAYARMTMFTKLKYVGVDRTDLIDIYVLYIRSLLEYCSTVWHSTLTEEQSRNVENVQKTCVKIILGGEYNGYEQSLKALGLETLKVRRENKRLSFGLQCLLHPEHSSMFPVNPQLGQSVPTRHKEHFKVNKAHSESYRTSTIPYIQRKLNSYAHNRK